MKKPLELEHVGTSLITIKGTDKCLGDLLYCEDHGTFDVNHGKVDVSKEAAEIHNKALDTALLDGLDKNCQIGQGHYAYWNANKQIVTSFIGTMISALAHIHGKTVTFTRKGKVFRGRLQKDGDCFNYRRIR